MTKAAKMITLIAFSFSISSCALSKAIYLGPDDFSQRIGPSKPGETYNAEDINGNFPEAIYIKTRTQSFDLYNYYILHDGLVFYKSIGADKEPQNWTLLAKTGIPPNTKAIIELSADADELVVLSVEGNFFRYCFDKTIAHKSNAWLDKQGWPVPEQLYFDIRTSRNLSWALGKRNKHVLYYEDIFGNQHHNGTMEIATTYVLLEDGQEIVFSDPGLPSDFSRNYVGPERGSFIAVSLSASASTMFVINEAGEMYTRLADFDTIGCDPLWFKYTYIPYVADLQGTDYFSNLNEWGLPSEDWQLQPLIPLAGKAAITRHITILQNGHGNGARELRVAGLDGEGNTGYWFKQIFDSQWEFKALPLYFGEDAILSTATIDGEDISRRGPSLDKSYAGFQWTGNKKEYGWEYQIPNFNILEGDCDFRISWRGETCTLKLHPVEMWTYQKRDYLPGRTGSPKMFLVTLEIPDKAFESLSDFFILQLTDKYSKNNRKLYHYTIAASNTYIIMRDTDNIDSLLFLTDETIPNRYSELYLERFVENQKELERCYSSELTVNKNDFLTIEELTRKISLNKLYVNELKHEIRVMKWAQLSVFKFNAGYVPAHYIVKITPLRFVDVPKIRTITSYGEKLVLANSAYINSTTNSRIWLYEKIIEMLEVRITCYSDILKTLKISTSNIYEQNKAVLPSWYSENITDLWDIIGIPRTMPGVFSYLDAARKNLQIPAGISIFPVLSDQNLSGWFLSVADSSDFSVFFSPRNLYKAMYSRKGKTPQELKLEIRGTLYINDAANSPYERYIIEHFLKPYINEKDRGIEVRMMFDGNTFEIREYPIRMDRPPIFHSVLLF